MAGQPHLRTIVRRYLKSASAPQRLLETPAPLVHCSAPSPLGMTQSSAILGERIPLYGVGSNPIAAPPQCGIYPLTVPPSDHSA